MSFIYRDPKLVKLSTAEREEFLSEFETSFQQKFPCEVPADCHHLVTNYVGYWSSLVSPVADAELVSNVIYNELSSWLELPDPFFAAALGEGSNVGYIWLVQRQGRRLFRFREVYFHTYSPVSFDACYAALLAALDAFAREPERSGCYCHELGEATWEDLPA
jgi:hypothetical protein